MVVAQAGRGHVGCGLGRRVGAPSSRFRLLSQAIQLSHPPVSKGKATGHQQPRPQRCRAVARHASSGRRLAGRCCRRCRRRPSAASPWLCRVL